MSVRPASVLVALALVVSTPGCGAPQAVPETPRSLAPAMHPALAVLAPGERTLLKALDAVSASLVPGALDRPGGVAASVAALVAAANAAFADGHPDLTRYLMAAAEAQEGGDRTVLDGLAREVLGTEALLVVLGPAEGAPADGPPVRFLEAGRRNAVATEWIVAFAEGMEGFASWLDLPRRERVRETPRDMAVAATLVLRGGERRGAVGPGTYLPFDRTRRRELGRFDVFWTDLMEQAWFGRSIDPFGKGLLAPRLHEQLTARAHRRFYVTRFATDQVGPQASRVDGLEVPLAETLGDEVLAPLQIAKADLLATLAHVWMARTDRTPREVEQEMLVFLPIMSLYTIVESREGESPSSVAHRKAGTLIVRRLVQAGALDVLPVGRVAVNLEGVRRAAQMLVMEIFEIQRAGDRAGAERLLGGRLPADLTFLLDRTGGVPNWREPIVYDVGG